jgi:hypothetical protein
MRGTDRALMIAVPLVALALAFVFLVISPKRSEVSQLDDEVTALQATIDLGDAQIAAAKEARKRFPKDYGRLVELGRAVPDDADQATFVYDISELGRRNNLVFQDFEVLAGTTSDQAPPPTPTPSDPAAPADPEAPTDPEAGSTEASPTLATEATAALLPLGATVGPAGLPVMPYGVTFRGSFFEMADFLGALDSTVLSKGPNPEVSGRLMTIDSFVFTADPNKGFPKIQSNLALTTYITAPNEGIAAGATPAGPPPAGSPSDPGAGPVPASASVTP